MSGKQARRGPRATAADDPRLIVEDGPAYELPPAEGEGTPPARVPAYAEVKRGGRWGTLLIAALGALVGLGVSVWMATFVEDLFARQDWIGWTAVGLLVLAGLAVLVIVVRETWALLRLARLGRMREDAESALAHDDGPLARRTLAKVANLYAARHDLAWARARLAEHHGDINTARQTLVLAERTLLGPLDNQARAVVAASSRRISVVTAVSPVAVIDMMLVAAENFRMLRRLATLYGARPGKLAMLRLARMVVTHIILTGGIALGDDVIHQLVGHGLTARLSSRLGEGIFNGALTARIGIAAIDVVRPMPFVEARRPKFREMVAEVAKVTAWPGKSAGKPGTSS